MSIKLSNYDYSHANNIGAQLQTPLPQLGWLMKRCFTCDYWDSGCSRIRKITTTILFVAIALIPASAAYLLGNPFFWISKTKVNFSNIKLAPHPITPLQDLQDDQSLNPQKLVNRLSKFNTKNEYNDHIKKLSKLCNAKSDTEIFRHEPEKRPLFIKELSIALKGLLKKMETGEISGEGKNHLIRVG